MIKFIDVTGKTEDEAIQSALAQLKMDRDDVSVEILERAKAGFLGIGSAPARVRVSYDDGKAEEVKPVEKPAAPKPEKKVEPASAPKAVPMYAPEVLQKKESRANDKPRTERGDRPAREDRRENRAPRAERAGDDRSAADTEHRSHGHEQQENRRGKGDCRHLQIIMGLPDEKGVRQIVDQHHEHRRHCGQCVL